MGNILLVIMACCEPKRRLLCCQKHQPSFYRNSTLHILQVMNENIMSSHDSPNSKRIRLGCDVKRENVEIDLDTDGNITIEHTPTYPILQQKQKQIYKFTLSDNVELSSVTAVLDSNGLLWIKWSDKDATIDSEVTDEVVDKNGILRVKMTK